MAVKLKDILNQVRFGMKYVKESKDVEEIVSCFSKEKNSFDYTKRIKDLVESVKIEEVGLAFEKICEEINYYENKVLTTNTITETFRKIRSNAIQSQIKRVRDRVKQITLKEAKEIDWEKLGKAISTSHIVSQEMLQGTSIYEEKEPVLFNNAKIDNVIEEDLKNLGAYII